MRKRGEHLVVRFATCLYKIKHNSFKITYANVGRTFPIIVGCFDSFTICHILGWLATLINSETMTYLLKLKSYTTVWKTCTSSNNYHNKQPNNIHFQRLKFISKKVEDCWIVAKLSSVNKQQRQRQSNFQRCEI